MTWFLHLCLWVMLVAKSDTVRPTTIGYLVVRMRSFFRVGTHRNNIP
ncbi:hypothetical protein PanWU01x14_217550 [Parasponia andersonii]|uniref:Uncharacterized protein n=1 Tax=Parasponia andersonii TaxID=3476 RepID=A0A2P5BR78_PARAD|nr:hypothetical protein PanWU01x14_217550 [Parasponia andersonii]